MKLNATSRIHFPLPTIHLMIYSQTLQESATICLLSVWHLAIRLQDEPIRGCNGHIQLFTWVHLLPVDAKSLLVGGTKSLALSRQVY